MQYQDGHKAPSVPHVLQDVGCQMSDILRLWSHVLYLDFCPFFFS